MNRKELEQALKEALVRPAPRATMFGIVRGVSEHTVQFCHPGPEDCVEVPLGLIEEAELVARITHEGAEMPVMKVTLKEPTDLEAKAIFSLLVASLLASKPSTRAIWARTEPPFRVMYSMSPVGLPGWPEEMLFIALRSGMNPWEADQVYEWAKGVQEKIRQAELASLPLPL
jgi:hypothetical protein